MTLYELVLAFIGFLIGYGVWSHISISRIAEHVARRHCSAEDVQLLDQTVVLKRMRLCKSASSLFALKREYDFEFSTVGDSRYQGTVTLKGKRVDSVDLEPYKITYH